MTTIAIIEDDDGMHKMLVEVIDNTPGYRCVCRCSNSKQALMEVMRTQPDVVLMDLYLSDGSGIDCLARLMEKVPGLLVIIVTVCKDVELVVQALRAGASGYLLRHLTPEEILKAVDDVKAGGAPMSREIANIVVRSFRQLTTLPEVAGLTIRENEMLKYLAHGLSNKEIAQKTHIAPGTVRNHLEHIFRKLHVRCRTEAAAMYFRTKGG